VKERSPDAVATVRRTDLDIAPVRVIHLREHGEGRSDDPAPAFGNDSPAPDRLVAVRLRRSKVVGEDVVGLRWANLYVRGRSGQVTLTASQSVHIVTGHHLTET
jgi:hypothetical protein